MAPPHSSLPLAYPFTLGTVHEARVHGPRSSLEQGTTTDGEDEQGNTTGGEDEQGNTTVGEEQQSTDREEQQR